MRYQDPQLPSAERAADLVGHMTLDQKVRQLGAIWFADFVVDDQIDEATARRLLADGIGQVTRIGASTGLAPDETARAMNQLQRLAIEESALGIPILVHEEAVAGYCARGATVFPQAIGLASTWDRDLVGEVAGVVREQLLAVGARQALSPVLDVARDPRWGRLEETYGESPELCGVLGTVYVRALQTDDLRRGVVCTGKHFLGYGLSVGGRNHAPVQLGPREVRETYAEPFAAAIRDAALASVMNSYSAIDGIPCAADPAILTVLLRDELGFSGTVVADYWAVTQLQHRHHIATGPDDAARQAITAGLDVELPALDWYTTLTDSVREGRLDESVIDTAVARVLTQKFALGLFEEPYVDEGRVLEAFETPNHRSLARRAAAESIVLLSNDGVLPLDANSLQSVAIVGPAADDPRLLQGDYHYPAHQEISMSPDVEMLPTSGAAFAPGLHYTDHVTPLTGLRAALPGVAITHSRGCDVLAGDDTSIDEATQLASSAEVAVVCVGGRSGLTIGATVGEGRDAASLDLTGAQPELVRRVAATGTPTVVVVVSGRAHTLTDVVDAADALVVAWCPGEEGGHGLADVLTGAVDASGRLPVTLPRHVGQVPVHHDQRERAHLSEFHGDYVDVPVEPLFAFGHGLSYATVELSDLAVVSGTTAEPVVVTVRVANTGDRTGVAVPQLYVRDRVASTVRPRRRLVGFARVELAPGEQRAVSWTVDATKLALLDPAMRWVTEPGEFTFAVGTSAADTPLQETVTLTGDVVETTQRDIVATEVDIT